MHKTRLPRPFRSEDTEPRRDLNRNERQRIFFRSTMALHREDLILPPTEIRSWNRVEEKEGEEEEGDAVLRWWKLDDK